MDYKVITSMEAFKPYYDKLNKASVIGVDTETTGLNPYMSKLRLIQLAYDDEVLVIDYFGVGSDINSYLSKILSGQAVKVFQNAKFDIKFLKANGIQVKGRLFDTMIAGQILRSSGGTPRVNLEGLVRHYLEEFVSKEEQKSDFSGCLTESQLSYAAKDAEVLLRLREKMVHELKRHKLVEVARLEFQCVYAIAHMEYRGIHLDISMWNKLTKKVEEEQSEILEKLYPYIGYPTVQLGFFESVEKSEINLNSNKQVIDLLKKYGLELENTSKHTLSRHLDHPIVKLLLMYRHTSKALTSFLYGINGQINPVTGRLHPHYGQIGAYSGRMSCGGPNIQQIPREDRFRSCFHAPKGRKLVIADYSQIELRVMAQITGDKRMIEAYRSGEDLHRLTASLVLEKSIDDVTKTERQSAKAVNFGLIFGMGAAGLKAYAAESYQSDMTIEEAELFRKRYFRAYKGVASWQRKIKKSLPDEERTLAGRKFVFRKDSGLSGRYNAPVQGTAADILKNALGSLVAKLPEDTYIVAVVHDEIVLECDEKKTLETASLLRRVMEEAGERYLKDVPVLAEASIADSWAGK
ncbi:bifunctional 3'-5' exonuclease/DNA polymerase [Acidaminobacter sp. JC074]|uniref:bifunctional 3'-5' exonuclease/DNA polymerase n=1 Tax=Acidaminobacter sp. JC074 TaxID=2530199 RepID=UPI001F0FFFA5|nr:bifunctional 3'-5' exonuclease/DNA polymerase [Acidaminobacter sp. JC074]MCH4890978.1 bifunctional 3'-5' exonuclease/DNA polymerase [Acidaminobacter sp. JC074]